MGDVPQRVPALFGLWMFETVRANHPAGLELSRTIVQLAEAMHSEDLLIEAHLGMGISRFFMGHFDEACRSFDLLLGLYDVEKHGAHRFQLDRTRPRLRSSTSIGSDGSRATARRRMR